MLTTFLAFLILAASVVMVLANLRTVVGDTLAAVAAGTERARAEGTLIQRAAFVALWLLIFGLSTV